MRFEFFLRQLMFFMLTKVRVGFIFVEIIKDMFNTDKNIITLQRTAYAVQSRVMSISINPSLDIIAIIGIIIILSLLGINTLVG